MPTLVLNGLTCPVKTESLTRARDEFGATRRAIDGTLLVNRRATKRRLGFTLTLRSNQEAHAWEALVRGEAHVLSFEASLYTSKGAAPTAGFTATRQTGTGKYGTGFVRIPNATTLVYAGLVGLGGAGTALGWTISLWRLETATWKHYVVTSDGRKWVDGVRNDAAVTSGFLAVNSAGTVTLTGITGATDFDDVVVWPVSLPSSWPPLLYATGRAFPEAPKLEVYGDVFPGSSAANPILMKGQVGEVQPRGAVVGGARDALAAEIPITLQEG